MNTDTSEKGLEVLILKSMTGLREADILRNSGSTQVHSSPIRYEGGYILGRSEDYDKDFALDTVQLVSFLESRVPDIVEKYSLKAEGPNRTRFFGRVQSEIARRGIIDVLRKGVSHQSDHIPLFYGTPSEGNAKAKEDWEANRFSITRQLQYSKDNAQLALDLCLFINGLPIATFELKNNLTKQTVEDAVEQYKRDRDPRELLFQFKRCLVHFAVDDKQVKFCTKLAGKASWFLPFNKGWNDGAGNPPNPHGIMTNYLWKEVLTREGLTDILENYVELVEETDERTGKKKYVQIFPRYHQRDVVKKLLADVKERGAGHRYLIQHSAGSGKSNSIAWLAHQLVGLEEGSTPIIDTVIVVTDRRNLDKQIKNTVKQFAQVGSTVAHAERSGQLREFIKAGKKIVITTVQKFPFILDDLGNEHRDRKFAILIDEAHSSQGGRTAAKMNIALSESSELEEEADLEDQINDLIEKKKMVSNASYFAFTATPKNKTLEVFGDPEPLADGTVKHRPFHSYTMKQAVQEGFIMDVLENYTPYSSYFKLVKTVEEDPEFDKNKAKKKLKRYVEGHEEAIRQKAEIIVDHFQDHVIRRNLIGGEARAMIVTGSIRRAIDYYLAVSKYLTETKSQYRALVAFSGEKEVDGKKVTEATYNEFASSKIEEKFKTSPYRFLICADKFQTGYDEPLLHTMYVDKTLNGIKAVQTLSRLNRAHPKKHDTFVLDFANEVDQIQASFEPYYRTTILSDETDPNKLHDLKGDLDMYQVYSQEEIDQLVSRYLAGAERDSLDPILDLCASRYIQALDEDGQVDFKSKAKAFIRTYGFLSSILPYGNANWEKLSIFLNFLVPKLPAPVEEDLSKGVLESIDMDSYRIEARATMSISLADEDKEIDPVPGTAGGKMPEPELDRLSSILQTFNDEFGNIAWEDRDKIEKVISEELPRRVASNSAYQNAVANNDRQNARLEHDKVLNQVIGSMMKDHMQLFKQYSDNAMFKKWLSDSNFELTYREVQESSHGEGA